MRNARKTAIGYATYAIGKRVVRRAVRRKARQVMERATRTPVEPRRRRRLPIVGALAGTALAAAGVVVLRKRRAPGDAGAADVP